MKCFYCSNEAAGLITEFRLTLCPKHMRRFRRFLRAKREAEVELVEDMRVIERLVKLNPRLISCPGCGSSIEIHHWERRGRKNVPVFKCRSCGFMG
ncbi:MAG: hypothetical protein GXN98_02060 [Euryarchaeota archaeon]|nr:hypothetical protein [Euryarchaeota archaeon]